MSDTTIDRLSIEITSNSTGAKQSIEDVATALGTLKKNGSVGTAVKNLKGLGEALAKLNVSSDGSAKINALATAVGRLSGMKSGGFASMVNSLGKIAEITAKLDDKTIDAFAEKVEKLSNKLTPLSNKMTTIQAGLKGINTNARLAGTGVQQMGKKVNVTTLNLANMITVVRGIVSALMPFIRLVSDSVKQAMEWDGVSQRFARGFGEHAEEAYNWIKRLNEEMGINTQQFMQYSSIFATMLQGFGIGGEDSAKMAIGYTELAYDIWAGYNDIYKNFEDAATAVRSAIAGEVEPIRRAGFTIIESTLQQTAANHGLEISLENATEAQKAYLRYLTLVDQAHAQNLVGTYAKEMNTAEGVMRTFAQQLKTLAQTFGSVFLPILVKIMPWLSAFVELLGEGIVYIASLFGVEIQPVDFSGFGGSGVTALEGVGDAADTATYSLGDTADAVDKTTDAIKDLKRATIGIDELNVISPPTKNDSGSGGSGGGGLTHVPSGSLGAFENMDIDSLWDESIFDQIQSQVDELKNKLKGFWDEWKTELTIIGGLLATLGMAKMLEHLGQALGLGDKFLGVMKTISKLAVTGIVIVLQYTLMAEFFDKFIDGEGFKWYVASLFTGAIGTGILYSMWGPAGLVIGLGVIAAASLKAIIDNGGITNTESAIVALTGLASAVGAVYGAVKILGPMIANSNLGAFIALLAEGHGFLPVLSATFPKLSDAISGSITAVKMFCGDFGAFVALLREGNGLLPTLEATFPKLSSAISGAWSAASTFLAGISAPMWAAIVAAIVALIGTIVFLKENWDEVRAAAKRFFDENIGPKIDAIKESFGKMKDALSGVLDAFGPLGDIIRSVCGAIGEFISWVFSMEGLGAIFEGIGFIVVEVLGGAIAGAFQAAMGVIEGFVQVITGLVEIVSGVVEAIVLLLSGDLSGAWEACKQIGQGIADVFIGLYDMTIGAVIDFVDGVISWFVDLWDELVGHSIVPDTIDGIVDCFLGLPGRVLNSVKGFVKNVITEFSKFKPVQIGVSLAKKGWSTISGWIGKIPTLSQSIQLVKSKWSSVKKWIGSIPVVSQSVKLVKSGWSSVKNWVGKIPTLSAGIKLVKSGWSTVKKWLGNLDFKLNFKLPKIGINWGSKEVLGFKISYPKSFYTYAKGGFPDWNSAELFVAREQGPELVGRIGNKNAVVNNDQIVEGISEGVYQAVLAAMRASESGDNRNINVYLDGRAITSSVEKHQKERGASLMGRQVYA